MFSINDDTSNPNLSNRSLFTNNDDCKVTLFMISTSPVPFALVRSREIDSSLFQIRDTEKDWAMQIFMSAAEILKEKTERSIE